MGTFRTRLIGGDFFSQCIRRCGCFALVLVTAVVVGCATTERPSDLLQLETLSGQTGVLDSAGNRLAIVDARRLHVYQFNDNDSLLARPVTQPKGIAIGHDVSHLLVQSDGSFWLHGIASISRWHAAEGLCTADHSFSELHLVTAEYPGSLRVVDEFYIDGTGVVGEQYTVGNSCQMDGGTIGQPIVTQSLLPHSDILIEAQSALVKAGPARFDGPKITYQRGRELVAEHPVFVEQVEAYKVVDMIASENRLIVLANTGAWELWDSTGYQRLLTGFADNTTRLHSLDIDNSFVIVGNNLIDMQLANTFNLPAAAQRLSIDSSRERVLSKLDGALQLSTSLPHAKEF